MNEYKVWLAKMLTLVVIALVAIPVLGGLVSAAGKIGGPRVAVIELAGTIEDSTEVLRSLYEEARSSDTKAIVLRVDSPGGAVAPSEEINSAVERLKSEKPIVVSMGTLAASGGLYASVSANKILCQPGTQTGSIGVIMQIPNYTNIADKIGVSMNTVKSGSLKDVGNQFRPMTEEDRKFLQDTTIKIHNIFIKAVADGRKMPEAKVREFADGRVILGQEAKELGLVDGFGDVYDAAREALAIAGVALKADEVPTLHYASRKKNFIERALQSASSVPAIVGAAGAPQIRLMAY
jgi:protease-4